MDWDRFAGTGWGGQGRRQGGASVTIHGVDLVQDYLSRVHESIRPHATSELRQRTKKIANETLIPELEEWTYWTPNAKLAHAIWATHKVRSDRIVNVQFGGKKPNIEGFRRRAKNGSGTASKSNWTTVTWGSEMGPKGGGKKPRTGQRGGARPGVNYYRQPRKESGYWAQPAVKPGGPLWNQVRDEYTDLLLDILDRWG